MILVMIVRIIMAKAETNPKYGGVIFVQFNFCSSSYLFLKNVSTMDVGISMAVKDVRCTRLFSFSNEPLW